MSTRVAPFLLCLWLGLVTACDSGSNDEPASTLTAVRAMVELTPTPAAVAEGAEVVSATIPLQDAAGAGVEPIRLMRGMTYEGRIVLYDADGRTLSTRIQNGAEVYRFFFRYSDEVAVRPLDVESDYGADRLGADLPVGLRFELTVAPTAGEEGSLRMRLFYYDDEPKGDVFPVFEPVVDFSVPMAYVRVGPTAPALLPEITGLRLRWGAGTYMVGDDRGFNRGDSLQIVLTSPAGSGGAGIGNVGEFEIFGPGGQDLTPALVRDRDFYQFFYTPLGPLDGNMAIFAEDEDREGRPFGRRFAAFIFEGAAGSGVQGVRIRLVRYDPAAGQVKDGVTPSSTFVLDFVLPINVP